MCYNKSHNIVFFTIDGIGFTSPTTPIFQTTTMPSTESSTATEATVITDPLVTENPLMDTDPQATIAMDTTEPQDTPNIANFLVTVTPQEPGEPDSTPETILLIVTGMVAGLVAAALVTATLVTLFLVLKRRKRRSLLPPVHIGDVCIGTYVHRILAHQTQ